MNKGMSADKQGAISGFPVGVHATGMAIAAIGCRGVLFSTDGIQQWLAAVLLAWACGATLAGASKLFSASTFARNWVIASWVLVVLIVFGSWQGVVRSPAAVATKIDWEKGEIKPPPSGSNRTDWEKGEIRPPAPQQSEVDAFLDAHEKSNSPPTAAVR